jgi:hypothetical protein
LETAHHSRSTHELESEMVQFVDESLKTGGSPAVVISISADAPIHASLYIRRYRVTGDTGNLIGNPHGDLIDTSDQTPDSLKYAIAADESILFQFLGFVAAAAMTEASGAVSIKVLTDDGSVLSELGGEQTVTISAFGHQQLGGGLIVEG